MGVNAFSSGVTANVTLTTTTETVVATVSNVGTPRAGCKVILRGWTQITTGTNTTALTVRVRRGTTITDPLVGEANPEQVEAAAGSTEAIDFAFEESPGELASASYVLTVQQTAASADGTALQSELTVEVLT
jgi:hypothetical protein